MCDISKLEGIEYICELNKTYKNELDSCLFSYNSCPIIDIKDKLNIRISELRTICSDLSNKINKYNTALNEYNNLLLYPYNKLTEEMEFNLHVYKKQIQDIEQYNFILKTAKIFGLCIEAFNKN